MGEAATDITLHMSLGTLIWVVLGLTIPIVLWCISVQRMLREILEMHRDPTNSKATLAQHELVKELYESTSELHSNNTRVIEENTRAITELSHFVQWFIRHSTGADAPPPMRHPQ